MKIGEAASRIYLHKGNSHDYAFGCTHWDNKQGKLSKSNICGNIGSTEGLAIYWNKIKWGGHSGGSMPVQHNVLNNFIEYYW